MTDLSNSMVYKAIINATTNPFRYKDAEKFDDITKFIAKGRPGSSTEKYAQALDPITNTHHYEQSDLVGVSVNGGSKGRIVFDTAEVLLAIEAGAWIVADKLCNRERSYNIGERELAEFLVFNGYQEKPDGSGLWMLRE